MSYSRRLVSSALVVTALTAFAAPAMAQVEQPLAPLPDRYIVVLKDSVERPSRVAERHAANRDAGIKHVYRTALKGYSAKISPGELKAVRRDPAVAYVEPDWRGGVVSQTTPTGIDRVFATANEALGIDEYDDGELDVDVAVIDSGIAEHPDLNLVGHINCLYQSCAPGGDDENGHGTHVGGTIGAIDNDVGVVGVAPGARLWGVKVIDSQGFGQVSDYIAAIDWITSTREDEDPANDIEVANSSLRYWNYETSEAFEEAIAASLGAGVVHVVAAGNEAEKVRYIPGNYSGLITVSALGDFDGMPGGLSQDGECETWWEKDDRLAVFSNYGSVVDVAAPGVCIRSTVPWPPGYESGWSGTSMASPHVAGAAAILASKDPPQNKADVDAIRDAIVAEGNFDWEDHSGDGIQEPLLDVSDETVFGLFELSPPTIGAQGASSVTATTAVLYSEINPHGVSTTYQFEYGNTASYGFKVPSGEEPVGSGSIPIQRSAPLKDLNPDTTYHYRVVAKNKYGITYGSDKTLQTQPAGPDWYLNNVKVGGKGSAVSVMFSGELTTDVVGVPTSLGPCGFEATVDVWNAVAGGHGDIVSVQADYCEKVKVLGVECEILEGGANALPWSIDVTSANVGLDMELSRSLSGCPIEAAPYGGTLVGSWNNETHCLEFDEAGGLASIPFGTPLVTTGALCDSKEELTLE